MRQKRPTPNTSGETFPIDSGNVLFTKGRVFTVWKPLNTESASK
jgi:hypothetical protein